MQVNIWRPKPATRMGENHEMIATHLEKPGNWWKRLYSPRIIAAFSFRYDSHLVNDLIENIRPFVDGWVSFDDRKSSEFFFDEITRQRILINAAMTIDAKWIFAVDPDERLESGCKDRFRSLTRWDRSIAWTFNIRELHEIDAYRIDGIWGQKRVPRLFPAQHFAPEETGMLHTHWFPKGTFSIRNSGLNIYHLKMIAAPRRQARSELYKHLDPTNKFQPIGYDYLCDDTGAQFESIPKGRGYRPPHKDDGELWMPKVS